MMNFICEGLFNGIILPIINWLMLPVIFGSIGIGAIALVVFGIWWLTDNPAVFIIPLLGIAACIKMAEDKEDTSSCSRPESTPRSRPQAASNGASNRAHEVPIETTPPRSSNANPVPVPTISHQINRVDDEDLPPSYLEATQNVVNPSN